MQKATIANNYLYNPKLKGRARALRNKGTKAETYLWKFALKKSIMGYAFFRQRPVMNYIADFLCPELMLIVEVDGATHLLEGAKERDLKRQQKLEHAGFKVLRIEDDAIINILSWVLSYIEQEIKILADLKKNKNSPL